VTAIDSQNMKNNAEQGQGLGPTGSQGKVGAANEDDGNSNTQAAESSKDASGENPSNSDSQTSSSSDEQKASSEEQNLMYKDQNTQSGDHKKSPEKGIATGNEDALSENGGVTSGNGVASSVDANFRLSSQNSIFIDQSPTPSGLNSKSSNQTLLESGQNSSGQASLSPGQSFLNHNSSSTVQKQGSANQTTVSQSPSLLRQSTQSGNFSNASGALYGSTSLAINSGLPSSSNSTLVYLNCVFIF
jgi:hypothetical protein